MQVYLVYKQKRSLFGGEATVIALTSRLLEEGGHVTRLIKKSSRGIEGSLARKASAFFGGIYNLRSYREMRDLLEREPPDIVHVHSLYPMFSPAVLVACRRAGVPVVMTLHNHALTCPNWHHLYKGEICEVCLGGREYRCLTRNCRENLFESLGYALRSWFARRFRLFADNVTSFIVLSKFAGEKLVEAGFRREQVKVVPNATVTAAESVDPAKGEYAAYAGRLSREKGVEELLRAASIFDEVRVRMAGDGPLAAALAKRAPHNVRLLGMLGPEALAGFYGAARFLVVPSICYDQFPVVTIEAMSRGLPVIASRIGGLPEIVDDGVTGLLCEPGDADDLSEKMRLLWTDGDLCRRMGRAGREKAERSYSEEAYYRRLLDVYQEAMARVRKEDGGFRRGGMTP